MPRQTTRHHRPPLGRRGARLRLEPLRQDGPTACVKASLRIVSRHFGREVDPDEIDRELFRDAAGCSFNTDLARIALRYGFTATCYGYNLYLTDPRAPAETLAARLREVQRTLPDPWYRPMIDSIVGAADAGVRYVVREPSFDTAARHLDVGVPVIAVVSYPALYGVQGNPFSGHDVVLTGYDRRRVYFVDPLHGEERSTTREHLMFAVASRSAIGTSDYFTVVRPA